jgi:hypothetical protein
VPRYNRIGGNKTAKLLAKQGLELHLQDLNLVKASLMEL